MNKPIFSFLFITFVMIFTSFSVHGSTSERKALIVYHKDWNNAVLLLQSELQGRGYSVTITDNASTGLTALGDLSSTLGVADRCVVYLAGHGSNPRLNRNDVSEATAAAHYIELNSGLLYVSQIAPLFEKIAGKGVHLTVIDGSCNGGESVLYAMGQKYCAVSTTGVYSPSGAGFPSPSNAMQKAGKPATFGLWWDLHQTASWMNGEIISACPERVNQRLFRNDNSDFATLSLFLRPSIGILTGLDLGGWNLHYEYCYLFPLIYPDEYASVKPEEKTEFTNSLQSYLATMHSFSDPAETSFTKLRGYLDNAVLLKSAAAVYTANYEKAWRTLANDPVWNVQAEPAKYASVMRGITPDAYKGEEGLLKMAGEIDFLLTILKTGFAEQESLLLQIDALAKDLQQPPAISSRIRVFPAKPSWPPAPGDPVKQFNIFERNLLKKVAAVENRLGIDRRKIVSPLQSRSFGLPAGSVAGVRATTAQQVITGNIEKYKPGYLRPVTGKPGISTAVHDAMKKQKLEELIAKFKAVSPTLYYAEARISFLLSMVEDAVVKVQSDGCSPCDQAPY
jgi:hypothetical protein